MKMKCYFCEKLLFEDEPNGNYPYGNYPSYAVFCIICNVILIYNQLNLRQIQKVTNNYYYQLDIKKDTLEIYNSATSILLKKIDNISTKFNVSDEKSLDNLVMKILRMKSFM